MSYIKERKQKITVDRASLVGKQMSELSDIAKDVNDYLLMRLRDYDNNSRAICIALLQAALNGAAVELWLDNQKEGETSEIKSDRDLERT